MSCRLRWMVPCWPPPPPPPSHPSPHPSPPSLTWWPQEVLPPRLSATAASRCPLLLPLLQRTLPTPLWLCCASRGRQCLPAPLPRQCSSLPPVGPARAPLGSRDGWERNAAPAAGDCCSLALLPLLQHRVCLRRGRGRGRSILTSGRWCSSAFRTATSAAVAPSWKTSSSAQRLR